MLGINQNLFGTKNNIFIPKKINKILINIDYMIKIYTNGSHFNDIELSLGAPYGSLNEKRGFPIQ